MNLDEIKALHKKVFRLFYYQHDDRNYGVMEDWRNHAHSVNNNLMFIDDCDGFAFTCVKLMLERGVPPENVLFIVCETETGEGHAVSGVTVDDKTYILENRYRYVYDWEKEPLGKYVWKFYMKFDDPGQWHKITNDDKK